MTRVESALESILDSFRRKFMADASTAATVLIGVLRDMRTRLRGSWFRWWPAGGGRSDGGL